MCTCYVEKISTPSHEGLLLIKGQHPTQTNKQTKKNPKIKIISSTHPPPRLINNNIKNITKKRRRKKRRTEGGRTAILSVKQLTAHSSKKNTTGTVLKGRKEGRKEG